MKNFFISDKNLFLSKNHFKYIFFNFFEEKIVREEIFFWVEFISDRNYISVTNSLINDVPSSIIHFMNFLDKILLEKKKFNENFFDGTY